MSLEELREALKELGDPQDRIRTVHVAGTNGKGSFCRMLSAVLTEQGYVTGTYITPYLTDHRDSLYIDGNRVSGEEFASVCEKLIDVSEKYMLTEYEFLTAAAFMYF